MGISKFQEDNELTGNSIFTIQNANHTRSGLHHKLVERLNTKLSLKEILYLQELPFLLHIQYITNFWCLRESEKYMSA